MKKTATKNHRDGWICGSGVDRKLVRLKVGAIRRSKRTQPHGGTSEYIVEHYYNNVLL